MGIDVYRLSVIPVLREGMAEADAQAVQSRAHHFDVLQCRCSSPEDSQKIMDVILAAFGTSDAFNETIRGMLRDAGITDHECSDCSSESSDGSASACRRTGARGPTVQWIASATCGYDSPVVGDSDSSGSDKSQVEGQG
ncbi:unnamed protein product [Prorocentrum cordatum]|uniref:Uncharacterized protein n=1 Tax=Prorocentrum cordatum TaxID=2364126 RepID=A0ABN9Q629_9DINO|nr:unnamed protein product [Polarella glacialis]